MKHELPNSFVQATFYSAATCSVNCPCHFPLKIIITGTVNQKRICRRQTDIAWSICSTVDLPYDLHRFTTYDLPDWAGSSAVVLDRGGKRCWPWIGSRGSPAMSRDSGASDCCCAQQWSSTHQDGAKEAEEPRRINYWCLPIQICLIINWKCSTHGKL